MSTVSHRRRRGHRATPPFNASSTRGIHPTKKRRRSTRDSTLAEMHDRLADRLSVPHTLCGDTTRTRHGQAYHPIFPLTVHSSQLPLSPAHPYGRTSRWRHDNDTTVSIARSRTHCYRRRPLRLYSEFSTLYLQFEIHVPGARERRARVHVHFAPQSRNGDTQVTAPLSRGNYNKRVARVRNCHSISISDTPSEAHGVDATTVKRRTWATHTAIITHHQDGCAACPPHG